MSSPGQDAALQDDALLAAGCYRDATVGTLRDRDIEFRSLTEGIDTATAAGRFTVVLMAALAEMDPPVSYAAIAREFGLAKTTVRRHLTEIPQPNPTQETR